MSRDRDRTRSRPSRKHDYLIKLRGLPPASNKEDIREFLYPCRIAAVHFFNQTESSPGECLVDLESEGDVRNALKKTSHCMGSRPIEVVHSNQHEYNFFAKRKGSLSWHEPVLRMNGLPYTCTMADVQLFFKDIEIARNGIYITRDMSDNALGGGYVAFVNMDNAYKAIDLYQQKRIAHRYIELTPSTYDEAKKTIANDAHVNGKRFAGEDDDESKRPHVNNGPNKRTRSNRRSRSSSTGDRRQELKRRRSTSASPQSPSRDAQNNHEQRSRSRSATHRHSTSSNHKVEYLIKMRGMPYTVSERDIRQFFPTTCQPVRIDIVQDRRLKRANGDGHAYFNTREEAAEAMKCDRKYMGTRYIELYFDSPRSRSTSPTNDRSRSRSQSQPRM